MTKKEQNGFLLPLLLLIGGVWLIWDSSKEESIPPVTADPGTVPAITDATLTPMSSFTPAVLPADNVVYNTLYNYSVPWRYAIDRMTAQERHNLYLYIFGYIEKHLRLYSYPGVFPDGNYDPDLYSAIAALSEKWHLGLLN